MRVHVSTKTYKKTALKKIISILFMSKIHNLGNYGQENMAVLRTSNARPDAPTVTVRRGRVIRMWPNVNVERDFCSTDDAVSSVTLGMTEKQIQKN